MRDKFGFEGPTPRVVVIENEDEGSGIVIREGEEFLDHPGWPMAVVIGHPAVGGGPASFFSSQTSFENTAKQPMSEDIWLPQIVDRLYEVTPSVVMGLPKAGKDGKMEVQCRALAFGAKAELRERASDA